MDSSPVLRQQSRNRIQRDFQRMKNEQNKMPVHPKSSKLLSAPLCSNQDIENKKPRNLEMDKKAPVRPGISRLPVLAKSLQTPCDFSQSHRRWEDKPLAGKVKKPKSCTRQIPFNLSQLRSSRMATECQQPLSGSQSKTGTHAVNHVNNLSSVYLKTQNPKSAKHPATLNGNVDSTTGSGMSNGTSAENTSQLQFAPSSTFKTSATLFNSLSSIPNDTMNQNSTAPSAKTAFNADACLDKMNLLSLKDPTKTSHAHQNMQLNAQGNFSKSSTDKKEDFQPDHAALLSVLQNEGINATGLGSATPQSKHYHDLPQQVSVMKSRQKAGPTAKSVKSVQFSPDAAALQSILQNEGVKAGGLVGGTPQDSIRQSGRTTSIYTAQRVPARKNRVETTGGPAVTHKETPLKEWLPQRVPNTRHQPMSAMKWHLSTPHTGTPGRRRCQTNPKLRQEQEIVQRLFVEPEDEQNVNMSDKDHDTRAEQLPVEAPTTKSDCGEKVETRRPSSDKDEDEEQRSTGGQPFFQAPQRESVIFFSTGKKLLRAPRFNEQQESSAHQEQCGSVLSEQRKVSDEKTSVSGLTRQINSSVQSLHKDFSVQKTCSQSAAVAMLRKRLPPLEELRLDEEVGFYTSLSIPTTPGFVPPRPRCGNPLASILNFEEASRFVPIGCGPSSYPCSPLSSPLQEK